MWKIQRLFGTTILLWICFCAVAYVEKKKRCAGCVAMVDEIVFQLENERPRQHIALGDHNHREFKPYATSELRVIEILDHACEGLRAYYENENARDVDDHTPFTRYDKFNLDRGALTGNQLHLLTKKAKSSHTTHNLQVYCESLMEELYDDLSLAISQQEINLYDMFCSEHQRCKGRRSEECCTKTEVRTHRRWKKSLDEIDRELVGDYFELAKEEEKGRDGYNKKAQKLYMEMIRREAVRKASESSEKRTVAEIINDEMKRRKKFKYKPNLDRDMGGNEHLDPKSPKLKARRDRLEREELKARARAMKNDMKARSRGAMKNGEL